MQTRSIAPVCDGAHLRCERNVRIQQRGAMKCLLLLAIASLLAVGTFAQTGGYVCNFQPIGDESTQDAVPIADFRTSGLDFVRPSWCVTHCADRKSVKIAARFDLANATTADAATYKLFHSWTRESGLKLERHELISGKRRDGDDDFNFCIDDSVSATVDQVVAQYATIEDMSEALNYYVNKPNWAYMIYDMGPVSIILTDNVKQDVNYCNKFVQKKMPDGTWGLFQVFSGKIKDN